MVQSQATVKVHFAFTFTVPHIHSSPITVRVGHISLKTILQYFRENCNYIYNNTGGKKQRCIGDCSLQAATFNSANKVKDVFQAAVTDTAD